MLNNSAIWLVNTKPQNKQFMHCQFSPKRMYIQPMRLCNENQFLYHRLLIYDVKGTTKIEIVGPFKALVSKLGLSVCYVTKWQGLSVYHVTDTYDKVFLAFSRHNRRALPSDLSHQNSKYILYLNNSCLGYMIVMIP